MLPSSGGLPLPITAVLNTPFRAGDPAPESLPGKGFSPSSVPSILVQKLKR
jgi:hypothetical protein